MLHSIVLNAALASRRMRVARFVLIRTSIPVSNKTGSGRPATTLGILSWLSCPGVLCPGDEPTRPHLERSTRTRLNSSGPLSRCRFRLALSPALAVASPMPSIVSAAIFRARRCCGPPTRCPCAPTVRPSSTRRPSACASVGVSGWYSAHLMMAARNFGAGRKPISGASAGRFFDVLTIFSAG